MIATNNVTTNSRSRVGIFGERPISLGTWPMSGDGNYGDIDEREAIATIHAALDAGVTSFDTAPAYGDGYAERLLGIALAGRRDRAVITTKFGVVEGRRRDSSRKSILAEVDRSLERLRTDYIDFYIGHWPDQHTPIEETVGALEEIVVAGKARCIGWSNYTVELLEQCRALRPIDVVQAGYSLFDRRMEREVLPYCFEHGIPLMTYGPLAHGLLVDGIHETTRFGPNDWRTKGFAIGQPIFTQEHFPRNARVVGRLRDEVARPKNATVPQLALSWVLDHPSVTTALVGARTPAELREDVEKLVTLDDAERATIAEIMSGASGRIEVFRPYARANEDWSK